MSERKRAKPAYRDGVGIVNPCGQFWSTEIYRDEEEARAAFSRFWRGIIDAPAWEEYRVLPARLRIQERADA